MLNPCAPISEAPGLPQPPSLSELPSDGFWDDTQWTVFWALMDTFVPAIVPKSSLADKQGQLGITDGEYAALLHESDESCALGGGGDKDLSQAFLEDKPSSQPAVRGAAIRIIARLPADRRDGLGKMLSGLSYAVCLPLLQMWTGIVLNADLPFQF